MRKLQIVNNEIQKILEDAAPEASRIYLKEYLKQSNLEISDLDLVIQATEAIDAAKRPSAKKHRNAIRAIGWLLSIIDDGESNKSIATDGI